MLHLHGQGRGGVDANTLFLMSCAAAGTPSAVREGRCPSATLTWGTGASIAASVLSSSHGNASSGGAKAAFTPSSAIGTGDFTLECWYKAATLPSDSRRILSLGNDAGSYVMHIGVNGGVSPKRFAFYSADGGIAATVTGATTTVVTTAAFHLALVRRAASGKTSLYVNGVLEVEGNTGAAFNLTSARTGAVGMLCRYAEADYPHIASVDQIRLSNIARYTGTFTPPTSRFQALRTKDRI